jgi:hypothetical protein
MAGLFAFPEQAAFGRVLPKSKIYAHAAPSARIRSLFVSQVEQIVWRYKLAPETIRLQPRSGVPEVEVFEISLKTPELHEDVLRCIDKAIPFPILFELSYEDRRKTIGAYKRPNESDSGKWVLGDYFGTPWHDAPHAREALPVALDLGGLYEQLLRALVNQPARRGETLKDHLARLGELRSLRLEYKKMEQRLQRERQFNRKVELNAQLKSLKKTMDALTVRDD